MIHATASRISRSAIRPLISKLSRSTVQSRPLLVPENIEAAGDYPDDLELFDYFPYIVQGTGPAQNKTGTYSQRRSGLLLEKTRILNPGPNPILQYPLIFRRSRPDPVVWTPSSGDPVVLRRLCEHQTNFWRSRFHSLDSWV